MKKMTRVLVVALIVAMLSILFTACGGTAKNEETQASTVSQTSTAPEASGTTQNIAKDIKDVKIGVSIGSLSQAKFQIAIDYFKKYAADNGFELSVQAADDDVQKQTSQCENLISQGVNVIILDALDMDAAAPIVDEAAKEGIAIISYDHFINNTNLGYYITMDGIKVGECQAKSIVEKVPKGNYVVLKGNPSDLNAQLFYQGEMNILQPYIDKGDIKVVYEQDCKNWDPNEALKHMEDALTKNNNDIQAVVAPNDGTAGAVIQALQAQGLAGKVPVSGMDAELAACQRVAEGTQAETTYLPLAKYNEAAMQMAVAVAMGKDPHEAVNKDYGTWTTLSDPQYKNVVTFSVGVIAVTKDNMVDTVIKDGFQKLEEVYANVPKDQWPAK